MKKIRTILHILILLFSGAEAAGQQQHCEPPAMGWSSWNAFTTNVTDSIIKRQADLIIMKKLNLAGYTYVNIDDCHFGERDSAGYMTPNKERFPGGMKAITDHIHKLGLKAGIYTDAGDNTCASNIENDNPDPYGIGAGLWKHEIQDAQRYFNDWNFDFIKIDYCGGRHLSLYEPIRYKYIKKVFDSVVLKPIHLNICCWHYPGKWAPEVGNSWRIGSDLKPTWESVCYMMDKNMYLSSYAGNGKYNDMDMLVIGYENNASALSNNQFLTPEEEEAHFGLWCIMASPLIIGCALDKMPQHSLKLITNPELIAVNQDRLGLQAHVVLHENQIYVLAKDLHTLRGKRRAIALYNPSDSIYSLSLPVSTLELAGHIQIRDLTHRQDLGKYHNPKDITIEMPPHSATILSVKGSKRIEPTTYEAEWGFIPAYNDIPGYENAKYVKKKGASCQAGVIGLGGDKERCLQWNNIYRKRGGSYKLSICYKSNENTQIELTVNGTTNAISLMADEQFKIYETNITLQKGYNSITIGNQQDTIPAFIDYIRLERM